MCLWPILNTIFPFYKTSDGGPSSYGPKLIMDYNVIFVSINYRLGPMGFLRYIFFEILIIISLIFLHLRLYVNYEKSV